MQSGADKSQDAKNENQNQTQSKKAKVKLEFNCSEARTKWESVQLDNFKFLRNSRDVQNVSVHALEAFS